MQHNFTAPLASASAPSPPHFPRLGAPHPSYNPRPPPVTACSIADGPGIMQGRREYAGIPVPLSITGTCTLGIRASGDPAARCGLHLQVNAVSKTHQNHRGKISQFHSFSSPLCALLLTFEYLLFLVARVSPLRAILALPFCGVTKEKGLAISKAS